MRRDVYRDLIPVYILDRLNLLRLRINPILEYEALHALKLRPGRRGLIPEMIQVCD